MDRQKKRRRLPQLTLLLRCAGGAYLLYLAWDLRQAAFSPVRGGYLAAVAVFALVGAALLACSAPPLIRGEYLRPGQTEEDFEEPEEAETADAEDAQEDDLNGGQHGST